MRIIPYDSNSDLEDIQSLSIMIKAVPFEGGYAPAFVILSPSEEYFMTIDELNCLMDGVEIASSKVDELITMILKSAGVRELFVDIDFDGEDEEEDYEEEDDED